MKNIFFSTALALYSCALSAQCSWPSVNYNTNNTRTNNCENTLTTQNVSELVEQQTFTTSAGIQVAPIVQNGIVYFGDLSGHFHALYLSDLNGTPPWSAKNLGASIDAPCTVTDTTIYVTTSDIKLHALDIDTGDELPGFPVVVDPDIVAYGNGDILSGPVLVDNLVIIPTTNGGSIVATDVNPQRHGSINAFNATTGDLVWRTIVQPPPYGGQGGSWSTASVDRKLKLIFIGTANSDNYPVNEYTDALLAIDYRNGKIKWSYQFTKDDVWGALYPSGLNLDVGASPNLFKIKKHSKEHDVVGVASKKGVYKAFKRKNGKHIWSQDIFPCDAKPCAVADPGAAYDKSSDTLYVAGIYDNSGLPLNALTVLFLNGNEAAEEEVLNSYLETNMTTITALDAKNGNVKWRQVTTGATSGSLTVANGVLYTGNWRGEIRAFDACTGDLLYFNNTTLPYATFIGAPITVVDGKVLVATGIAPSHPGSLVVFGLP